MQSSSEMKIIQESLESWDNKTSSKLMRWESYEHHKQLNRLQPSCTISIKNAAFTWELLGSWDNKQTLGWISNNTAAQLAMVLELNLSYLESRATKQTPSWISCNSSESCTTSYRFVNTAFLYESHWESHGQLQILIRYFVQLYLKVTRESLGKQIPCFRLVKV